MFQKIKSILFSKASKQLQEEIEKDLEQEDPSKTTARKICDENTIKHNRNRTT